MAIPFEPLTTEKLEQYFQRMIDANRGKKHTDRRHKMPTGKKVRNKLFSSQQILETWRQRQTRQL